jgi:hypothetical protein
LFNAAKSNAKLPCRNQFYTSLFSTAIEATTFTTVVHSSMKLDADWCICGCTKFGLVLCYPCGRCPARGISSFMGTITALLVVSGQVLVRSHFDKQMTNDT